MRTAICGVTALLLFAAIFPLPYGYYQFLRIEAFAASLYAFAFLAMNARLPADARVPVDALVWPRVLALLAAIVFNPFMFLAFGKAFWVAIDLFFCLFFAFLSYSQKGR